MVQKKAYTAPQLVKVALDNNQAILTACSLATTALSNGMNAFCRANCKSHNNMVGSDSGARPS